MMFNKEQVQKAIAEINGVLSKHKIIDPVLTGQDHIILANDMKTVQGVCMAYFEEREAAEVAPEKKDVGTNIIPIHSETSNKNS